MRKRKFLSILFTLLLIIMVAVPSLADEKPEAFDLISTKAKMISRVTGETQEGEDLPNPNQTHIDYGLGGTDLGIIWDATTDPNDPKVMMAFGDSFDDWDGFGGGGTGWRSNLLAISKDTDLSDGLSISSMITEEDNDNYAKEIIHSEHDTSGNGDFTAIPTAGITVGDRHFIHYMQIRQWGDHGRWTTNFSEIAISDDEGKNWKKSGVKWDTDSNFAQAAYVKEEGYVYMFGTPSGRFGSVYLARVKEEDILEKENYEYWNGFDWIKDDESVAIPIIENPVSELSVQYNSYYDKWIMMYFNGDRYSMVIRTSSSLTEGWSAESVVATGEEFPQLYGGYIHPWTNDGKDLYFVMSMWGPYNVFLMKSELEIGTPSPNLIKDPSFEEQDSNEIKGPWVLESGNGGVDRGPDNPNAHGGQNNVFLKNNSGWNAIHQIVEVEKNKMYELSGFIRTSPNNTDGYFGVRDLQGNILEENKFENSSNYTPQTIRFNSGDNETVQIFTGMWANGETWIQLDNYSLFEVDTTPPEITLNGEETIEIDLGGDFEDPGATAYDDLDGDLTEKIEVSGEVNTNIIGTYELTYHVTDSDGNEAKVTRTVIVTGNEYMISNVVFTDKVGNILTNLPKSGFIKGNADIKSNTSDVKPVTFAVVLYDNNGEIINMSGVTTTIDPGVTQTFSAGFMMPENNSAEYAEIFLAKSLTDLTPLSKIEQIKVADEKEESSDQENGNKVDGDKGNGKKDDNSTDEGKDEINGKNNEKDKVEDKDKKNGLEDNDSDKDKNGEELPNTATNIFNHILIGSIVLVVGGILYILHRRKSLL